MMRTVVGPNAAMLCVVTLNRRRLYAVIYKKHENMEIVIIIAVASLLFCWYELCIRIG